MFQRGRRLVVGMVAVMSASLVFADGSMCTNLDVTSAKDAKSNGLFTDVLDTPSTITSLATRSLLNGITRAGKRLVAVGARGHILYSDDEGKSWKQASVPVSSDLTAVNFPTPQQGWEAYMETARAYGQALLAGRGRALEVVGEQLAETLDVAGADRVEVGLVQVAEQIQVRGGRRHGSDSRKFVDPNYQKLRMPPAFRNRVHWPRFDPCPFC